MDWLRVLPIGISTCPPSVAHVASGAHQLGGPPGGSPNWTRCSSQTASNASLKLMGRPEFDPGLAVPVVVPIHKSRHPLAGLFCWRMVDWASRDGI